MSRYENRTKWVSATHYNEQGDCRTRVVSATSVWKEAGLTYRWAPTGSYPFHSPTAMTAHDSTRGGNETFKRWAGSSQEVFDLWGDAIEGTPTDASSNLLEARDLASQRAYDRLYEQLTAVDLSETFAQSRATAKTVNLAQTIHDMTRTAIGRFGLTRVIGAGFMWANFGVKPLVNDIYTIASDCSRAVKKPFTVKAGNMQRYEIKAIDNPTSRANGSVHVRINCKFQTGAFDSLSNLTSMDPAYILWTSLPWTFISDYIYNIGGYLRQMELQALYNTAFLSGTESARISQKGLAQSGFARKTGWSCKDPYFQYTNNDMSLERYERGVLPGLPSPRPPRFNLDLKSNQLLNVAAALSSLLAPGPRKGGR